MLALIRREFYRKVPEKQFFQERPRLKSAITYPARWLNERGVTATASLYRRVLRTVIDAIKQHGRRDKIDRFEIYFLDCVQKHMKHHGEEYYEAAKAARSAADVLPTVLRRVQVGAADLTTAAQPH